MGRLINEKGITLVELLAALALTGIIGALSFQLLTGIFTANSVTENDISLKQEANIILTSLRDQAREGELEVCISGEQSLLVNGEDVLRKDGLIITDFHLENRKNGQKIAEKTFFQAEETSCFTSKVSETLAVTMTITTKEGHSNYEISSVIPGMNESDRSYTIEIPREDDSGEGEPANNIFTTQKEFEVLDPENIDESIANLNNANVTLPEDLYVEPSSTWRNNTTVDVTENTLFGGDITMKTDTTFIALNTYFRGNMDVPDSGTIDTTGSIRVDGETHLESEATIISEGFFFANKTVKLDDNTARIEVKRDIYLNSGGTLNGSSIVSDNNIYLHGSFTLDNGATIESGKDMYVNDSLSLSSKTALKSKGSITIEGDVDSDKNTSVICAMGDITINGSVEDKVKIKENVNNLNGCH